MCAINGITANCRNDIQEMNKATKHRGPDGTGIFESDGITLGHNRLAVIDLSDEAAQPMKSADGRYVITYNGELYNYRELCEELKTSYDFKTKSDTEVLLAAYSTWGEDAFNRLRGMFAFALWDARDESLLLVRDQMGIKPVYYAVKDRLVYFSSELTGLIAGTDLRTISSEAVNYFLTLGYVPSPHSLIKGIQKLQPGHLLRFRNHDLQIERYWHPELPKRSTVDSGVIRSTIGTAVDRQMVSDRPIGVFLSGGLDSSIVTHHAAASTENLRTFSVSFEMVAGAEEEAEKFNTDALLAQKTAEYYKAQHTTFTLSLSEVRSEYLAIVESLDEPIANPTFISQYLLSKWVRDAGVVVALGGDGGDELFCGYTRHKIFLAAYYFQKFPQVLQKTAGLVHPSIEKLGTPFGVPLHMQLMALKRRNFETILKFDPWTENMVEKMFQERYDSIHKNFNQIDQFLQIDRETWLADESLARSDRASMAHGLETRVPMLDLDVVSLADEIYGHKKFYPWEAKRILRRAYRGHLPQYLFKQPKRGWVSPGAKWLRDPEITKTVKEIFSDSYYNGLTPIFDWTSIQTMLSRHIAKEAYSLHPLWNILNLQIWAHKNRLVYEG